MARTPDLAGALGAVVARTLKGTIGPRFRKLETQMRRLERRLRKAASGRKAAGGRKRGGGRPGRRRGAARRKGRRSKR